MRKKIGLLGLLFLLFSFLTGMGQADAANPTVMMSAVYSNDGSSVNPDAVEPNRETTFTFTVNADTSVDCMYIEQSSLGRYEEFSLTSTPVPFGNTALITLSPGEVCSVKINVTDGNGLEKLFTLDIKATGTPNPSSGGGGGGCSATGAAIGMLPLALWAFKRTTFRRTGRS